MTSILSRKLGDRKRHTRALSAAPVPALRLPPEPGQWAPRAHSRAAGVRPVLDCVLLGLSAWIPSQGADEYEVSLFLSGAALPSPF